MSDSNVPSRTRIVSGVADFLLIIGEPPCLQKYFLEFHIISKIILPQRQPHLYKIPFLSSILTEKLLFGLIPRNKQYFSCIYNKQVAG